jgi:2-phospho-L-lactate guanylyltransferase
VTGDRAARVLATGRVTVLRDEVEAGQSAAAQIGIRHAIGAGFARVLLVPGDTPLLDPRELDLLLERAEADRVPITIVSDRHGTGTNALVLSPPGILVPSFGPGSLARHVEAAAATGLPHRVEHAPSLEHDVDTPDDLAVLWNELDAERGRAQRTRGALHQLERSGALRQLERPRAPAEPERPGARPVAAPR